MTSSPPFRLRSSDLAGRVAVITGASRGLGAGLAERFAEHGLALGLCARSVPAPPVAPVAVTASVDVTDSEALATFTEQVVSELGSIDIWINNAGVLDPMGPQRNHSASDVDRALLVNIGGVVSGTRAFTRSLLRRSAGQRSTPMLVNISSGAATSTYSGWSVYGATKAAVDRFTCIVDVEEPDLRCYSIAPGVVDTDMQALIRTHDETTFPAIERFREMHATGRWNSTSWIADHILAIYTGQIEPEGVVYRVPAEPLS